MIIGRFLNLFIAFCTRFSLSYWIIVVKISLGIIFRFETIFAKKLIKSFRNVIIIGNDFFGRYLFIIFLCTSFFSIEVIFERAVTLSVKKDLIVLQNVLLSVKSVVLILSKSFGLAFLIRLKQQLHCLLYAFLSICILMFKKLSLRRDCLMISLVIVLLMKRPWFASFFQKAHVSESHTLTFKKYILFTSMTALQKC